MLLSSQVNPCVLLVPIISLFLLLLPRDVSGSTERCSDVACASVVSKCMLTQACKCDINRNSTECSCCKNCTQCLGDDYTRCCSCLGLCEATVDSSLSKQFQVGDIDNPFNALFVAFNEAYDEKWTTHTFPIDVTLNEFAQKAEIDGTLVMTDVNTNSDLEPVKIVNCTVMYWNQCLSVSKCLNYCSQRGAASYRYFFDGCCECVGLTCLNYGMDQSRCTNCSNLSEDEDINGGSSSYKDELENVIN